MPLVGCGAAHIAPGSHTLPGPGVAGLNSLKAHAANAHMLFGFAVDVKRLRTDEAYRALVQQQCSIMVTENAMKWRALRPAIDRYFFDDADMVVQFANSHRIKLRGHTLCWHESLPDWFASQATTENARQLLRDHIRTVAGRYAGRVHSWDVVNEAIDVKDGRPDGMRTSPWLRLVGTDYVETAFRVARDADPAALLTYNDYGIEADSEDAERKRAAVLLLLRRMKQRNVPIDAVGIQSHLEAGPGYSYGIGLQKFVQSCKEMALEVFVTELDVNDRHLGPAVDARDLAVAERYRTYLDLLLRNAAVNAVLTWGVCDAQTWLNSEKFARKDGIPQRPLLFDDHMRAKPAFAAVRAAFDARGKGTAATERAPAQLRPLRKL